MNENKETVTIENYQELAMRTCLPTSKNWDYAIYNYRAELFELYAKIESFHAKRIRDGEDFNASKYLDKIKDEIGDCYWQLALLCELGGRKFEQGYYDSGDEYDTYISLISEPNAMNEFARLYDIRIGYNFDINDILQRNIDKLQSRKERGVLKGSGDER